MSRADPGVASEFGRRVREHRTRLGVSQMELGEGAGFHFTYVSQVERGVRNVTLSSALRFAGALGVEISELLAGMKPPPDVRGCSAPG